MMKREMILVVLITFMLIAPQITKATPVPDTGQIECFNNNASETITCPAPGENFYGQDGQYNINTQSYTKLDGNGQPLPDSAPSWVTVRDNMTGLIWEVKTNDGTIHDWDNTYTWQNAYDVFIATLNNDKYGGFNDWRLPTARELAFIRKIVYATGACINLDFFPNTKADYYFTSDISYVDVNQRVVVNFDSSGVYYDWMNTLTYVQAVRGEYFVNDFIDNSDGTISDRSTGLMWLKDGSCLGDRTWQAALDTVYDLNVSPGSFTCLGYNATYDDWRMPNANELLSIVEYSTYNPTIDTNFFANTIINDGYWTSTTHVWSPSYYAFAVEVLFNYGFEQFRDKDGSNRRIRPVRGGTFLQFDVNGDGKTEGPVELLFCEGESKEIALWLTGWDAAYRGNVESVDYYFTWDPDYLDVIVTPVPDGAWTGHSETKTTGQYHLQLSSTGGISGQAMKLHTVTLKCTSSPATAWMQVDITAGGNVTPVGGPAYYFVNPSRATINTICTGAPLTCTEQDHCDVLDGDDVCPSSATITDDQYAWEPKEATPLCEGHDIIVSHTRRGFHTVTESSTPTVCDSACFNECYENCGYVESQGCYLRCIKGCANGVCPNWADQEVCYEYQSRIDCNYSCYFQCRDTYDEETQTSYFDKLCGFFINEPITVRDSNGICTGTQRGGPYTLKGSGTASVNIALPLQAGTYDICSGTTRLGDPVTVDSCGGTQLCSLALPTNSFLVDRGIDDTLSVTLTNVGAGGTYALSLARWEDDGHTVPLAIPSSLQLPTPSEVTVSANNSVSFDISAVSSGTVGGQGHWANVIVKATSASCTCESVFDLDIRNISVDGSCADSDGFEAGDTVYGRSLLGLAPNTSYNLRIVDNKNDWADGMVIPASCTHCVTSPVTSFTTDATGQMGCGTVLWTNAQVDSVPAYFDIVIDVNGNGIYDEGTDFLDAGPVVGFAIDTDSDGDGVLNVEDNCWEVSNPYQIDSDKNCGDPPFTADPECGDACEDTDNDGVLNTVDNCWEVSNLDQLDTDGDCPDPPYTADPECGDACEIVPNQCLADIAPIPDGDCKVNLPDLVVMKGEFLRPDCATNPCHADITPAPNGDNKVNLNDLVVMKGEFLRADCCP